MGAAGEQGGRGWDGVPGRLDIVIPAESWLLGVLRRAVAVWLSSAGRPQDDAEPLLFAIGEIVGNSIDHAHPGETIGRISVTVVCERGADGLVTARVEVSDDGRWRVATACAGRGNGLALVAAVTSQLDVVPSPTGTRVSLTSRPVALRSRAAGPSRSR
ncbi:hypothetical protein GCM10009836_42410 [Pseudonocardia ailaonensis]|uniref:Histidine kinase/HSP90-like ATPase domain-containing protein n=1 Tax=Pseudonocardia ailaonensis TaxID=367279 RepID=A0ABN2N8N6_9PSEU